MIVDYFPSGKVLGGQVVKLATSHRNLHETWKRWCPSSPSFQVQLEKIVRSMMRSDHSCALCASCILFGKLSHITGVPTENHWVVDLPPQKKMSSLMICLYHLGITPHLCWFVVPPPTFWGMTKKILQSLWRFFSRPPICCLSPPSSTSGQPWKVSGWQRLGFVWFFGPLSMGPGAEVCVFFVFQWPQERAGL